MLLHDVNDDEQASKREKLRLRLHNLLVENLGNQDVPLDHVQEAHSFILQSLKKLTSVADDDDDRPSAVQQNIPFSLFSIPACLPPLTTVVPLCSLPYAQRSNFVQKWKPADNISPGPTHQGILWEKDTSVVEVLTSSLENTETSLTGNSLARRPLAGNLSTKLVEYTRGQVGKRNPFRPGGMDSDLSPALAHPVDVQNLSSENKKSARQVLEKGAVASYKDGTLLLAPPGMPFTVGLHPRDFFPDFTDDEIKLEKDVNTPSKDVGTANIAVNTATFPTRTTTSSSSDFDLKILEDDSLFEDDPSSENDHDSLEKFQEDSSNEDDMSLEKFQEDSSNEVHEEMLEKFDNDSDEDSIWSEDASTPFKKKEENIKAELVASLTQEPVPISPSLVSSDTNHQDPVLQDVDALLQDLSISDEACVVEKTLSLQKKRSKALLISNEALASMKGPKKLNDNLSWAVTSLLPLNDFHALVPNPAITYPFELDDFQKQAVARLERGECIFVAAHTSAGKTVCAEYAIALSRKHGTRTIYTSPIKALSNQKYRDFKDKFGADVGIITGDVQIGADASCLIMTTEILRSMLYRGADIVRDIEFVIFDEVHYINDLERGVVYEEVIIMLPDYVKLIFLSATTPNTVEFSEWIGRTKQKHVHVIRTDYRPVPLSHYLYAGQKLHKIMEANGGFIEKGWSDASKALIPLSEREKLLEGKKKGPLGGVKQSAGPPVKLSTGPKENAWQQPGSKQEYVSLVKFLERESLMPAVVFSFSRKKCEELANMLYSLDLNNAAEKATVHLLTTQASSRLSQSDSRLPQVQTLCEMVKRGIGVHHSGLLPLLKEVVEILFSKNLIKVLFATETFAMGVNMPAKSVVFNAIRKHDGVQHRFLQPGEYVQMGGRAGRRGLDKVGTVIITCFGDEPPPAASLRQMLTGSATKLLSQFRLTFNMILNLLRVEDMSVESMIKRSFSEFATQRAIGKNDYPKLLAKGLKTLTKLDENFRQDIMENPTHEDIEKYYHHTKELLDINRFVLTTLVTAGSGGAGALCQGRLLLVTSARGKGLACSVAVLLKAPMGSQGSPGKSMICLVLLPRSYIPTVTSSSQARKPKEIDYVGYSKRRHYSIKEIDIGDVLIVTDLKIKLDPNEFYDDSAAVRRLDRPGDTFFASASSRNRVDQSNFSQRGTKNETETNDNIINMLIEAEAKEFSDGLGVFEFKDALKSLHHGQQALDTKDACYQMTKLISTIREYNCHKEDDLVRRFSVVEKKETLRAAVQKLRHLLSHESLQLFPDFMQRKAVLHNLGYIDENDTVCIKGRVACEVNTCEELIVTELVFGGHLNSLSPAELAAVLSALVFQEKTNEDELSSDLPQNILDTCKIMKDVATMLGTTQKSLGLNIDPSEYSDNSLKFGLVHVVYDWAMGVPFSNICELTSVQEGSIVRCITRLDELCREVRSCARVVGNPTLYRKTEEACAAIKRDIVFVASLYVN